MKSLSRKAKDYRDSFDNRRKNKMLFDGMIDISANVHSMEKIPKDTLDIMENNESVECQISMVVGGSGQDLSDYNRTIMGRLREDTSANITSVGTFQGIGFIDVCCNKNTLEEIAESPAVISVDLISNISLEVSDDKYVASQIFELDDTDLSKLGKVCVMDTGVHFPDSIKSVITGHTVAKGVTPGNALHGTLVASKLVFGNIFAGEKLKPRCLVHDHCIMDGTHIDPIILANRIREAIELLSNEYKIFVLSINKRKPNDDSSPDPLSIVIDEMSMKHRIRIVTSVGNHMLGGNVTIENILSDSDSNVRPPADSVLSIAVGSVNGHTYDNCCSKKDEPTTYTCKGPGMNRIWKPDIVTRSACLDRNNSVIEDEYSRMVGPKGFLFNGGTSFSAPFVAGRLEEIRKEIDDKDIITSESLLIASAVQPIWVPPINYIDRHNVVGYGILPDMMKTVENKVILLHCGKIKIGNEVTVKVPIPTDTRVSRNKNERPKVIVTCVSDIKVDHCKGIEAVRANVVILSEDGSQNTGSGMDLWSPIHQRTMYFRQNEKKDWTIRLAALGKKEMKDKEILFALCVAISDPNGYDLSSFIKKRATYPVFTTVPMAVRTENNCIANVVKN